MSRNGEVAVELRTVLSPDQVSELLSESLDPVGIPFPFAFGHPSLVIWDKRPGRRRYMGQVSRAGFALQVRPRAADPFALVCTGSIEPEAAGSRVQLHFHFHWAATWFFRVAALWILSLAVVYVFQERTPASATVPFGVVVLSGGVIMYAKARHRAQRDELLAYLQQVLVQHEVPRQVRVSA